MVKCIIMNKTATITQTTMTFTMAVRKKGRRDGGWRFGLTDKWEKEKSALKCEFALVVQCAHTNTLAHTMFTS